MWSEEEEEVRELISLVDVLDSKPQLMRVAGDDERRQRIAAVLGSMFELVVKMVMWVVSSYREEASSRIAALLVQMQALHCVAARGAAVAMTMASKRRRVEKEWWVKPRLLACDKFVAGRLDADSSSRLFNMSPETFEWLCCALAPLVHKNDTNFRSSIPPRKRIAIAIHRLAVGSSYLEVSRMFAVGEATVLTCTREVYAALSTAMGGMLAFPTDAVSLSRVARGFYALTSLPNCCGLVTALRFKIKRPSGPCGSTYLDEDTNFSLAAQVVVDSSMRILNIAVGFPGGIQDAKILKQSAVFDKVRDGLLLNGRHFETTDLSRTMVVSVPQYLVSSNSNYPLLPWLMLPYHPHETQEQCWKAEFNQRLKQVAVVGQQLSAALTSWGVLAKPMNVDVHTAVELVVACAILHNVLVHNDKEEVEEEEEEMDEPSELGASVGKDHDAEEIRDALASQFILTSPPRVLEQQLGFAREGR